MHPTKAKEIITIELNCFPTSHTPDLNDALKEAITALDLTEKLTTLYNPTTPDLQLLQCFCESCFKEQWHIITITGRLECLGCRAR